jgi:hypothetical protein
MNQLQLARQVCEAYNRQDASLLNDITTQNLHYESQWVITPITGRPQVVDYLSGKFKTICEAGAGMYAELAWYGEDPCAILSQGSKDNHVATLVLSFAEDKISGILVCAIPSWTELRRTGEYPGKLGIA